MVYNINTLNSISKKIESIRKQLNGKRIIDDWLSIEDGTLILFLKVHIDKLEDASCIKEIIKTDFMGFFTSYSVTESKGRGRKKADGKSPVTSMTIRICLSKGY